MSIGYSSLLLVTKCLIQKLYAYMTPTNTYIFLRGTKGLTKMKGDIPYLNCPDQIMINVWFSSILCDWTKQII